MTKPLPFDQTTVRRIAKDYPTPFYLYDEAGIRGSAQVLNAAFGWCPGFKNFFAVKATPNPALLKILRSEGMGFDCSSLMELLLAERVGARGEEIMFTSNDTSAEEFRKAKELGAIINLDDITHLDYLEEAAGLPELVCFRYNPGKEASGNSFIGEPAEAKFGMTKEQVIEAAQRAKQKGVKRLGLHAMVVSNNLDIAAALDIVKLLFELAREISTAVGTDVEFINVGGGIGIPYKPEDMVFDLAAFSDGVERLYRSVLSGKPKLYMECGRYVTGPHGYLIATVMHLKQTYKSYIGLDASMHNLMRPALYGAYHHITILGKDGPTTDIYDVTGSLCENNDKFAVDRKLPKVEVGDTVAIHDAGAHGHAMGFNYNGKLRSAELLLHPDGSVELIRRAETAADYFATLVP